MKTTFKCSVCKQTKTHIDSLTTGYGLNRKKEKVCFACCAIEDKKEMIETGRQTLYLTIFNNGTSNFAKLTNWPGTLKFDYLEYRKGLHNIAGIRYDVWFNFNGYVWHGVNYGENTQICHCKQTKQELS